MIKLVLFDLDGTLVDSLPTITECCNAVNKHLSLPNVKEETVQGFVGDGLNVLLGKMIPEIIGNDELVNECTKVFLEHYHKHPFERSRLYSGISDLIDKLNFLGIKIGVITNKEDTSAQMVIEYFLADRVQKTIGIKEGIEPKPDPSGVLSALEYFNCDTAECLFVGDMSTDISVAINSGVESVGVTWGYLSSAEMKELNPNYIINSPQELLKIIEELK